MEFKHVSILFNESIDFLITDKNGIYLHLVKWKMEHHGIMDYIHMIMA